MTQTMALTLTKEHSNISLLKIAMVTFVAWALMIGTAFAGTPASWQNQEFKVKGTWSIESRADGNYLVLSDDFKTKKAPDLKFFLSKKVYSELNGKNATEQATLLAKLTSTKGGATYKIPAGIKLGDYQSLVLHCEQYSKLWASTPLK